MAPNSPSNVSVGSALRAQRLALSLSRPQLVSLCAWLGLTTSRGRKYTQGMVASYELGIAKLASGASIFRAIAHAAQNPESVSVARSKADKPATKGATRQFAALVAAFRALEAGDVVSIPGESLTVRSIERRRGNAQLSRVTFNDGTSENAKTILVRGVGTVFVSYNA